MDKTIVHESKAIADADAEFLGYQKTSDGRIIPLYNIIVEHHPLSGSTVTGERLLALKLRIPDTR